MNILRLDKVSYLQSLEIQQEIVNKRINKEISDTLLIWEYNSPVITIGKNGKRENVLVSDKILKTKGIELFYVNRGGDVTLHCPGQIVVYPIVDLKSIRCDLHWYIRKLEEVFIELLGSYNITSSQKEGYTGVWVNEEKIASIGIGVRNWVTFHGVSLNVNPDLEYFSLIMPCGIENVKITSMNKILNICLNTDEIQTRLVDIFTKTLYEKVCKAHTESVLFQCPLFG